MYPLRLQRGSEQALPGWQRARVEFGAEFVVDLI